MEEGAEGGVDVLFLWAGDGSDAEAEFWGGGRRGGGVVGEGGDVVEGLGAAGGGVEGFVSAGFVEEVGGRVAVEV